MYMVAPKNKIDNKLKEAKKTTMSYPLSDDKDREGQGSRLKDSDYLVFTRKSKPTVKRPSGTRQSDIKIFIPPQSLNYARSYTYDEQEQALGQGVLSELSKFGQKDLFTSIKDVLSKSGTEALRGITASAADIPAVRQAAAKGLGFAFNPNIEVYFKQPNFRTFEFTFPFLPKNSEESIEIEKIVEEFEKYSMPKINKENKFIYEYPDIWKVSTGAKVGKGFDTKACVLENFNVSYGADAGYTTFIDGRPVMTTLKLSFKEIELWSQEDWGKEER